MKEITSNLRRFPLAIFTFCILALAGFQPAMAQSGTIDNTGANDRAKVTTDRMAADLNLNDTQREQLLEQNTAYHLNQQSVHQNSHSDEERSKMSRDHEREYENNLKNILDKDQYDRYNKDKSNYDLKQSSDQKATPNRGGSQSQPRNKR